ncbi:hypothetical protein GQR58_015853 [Nymphon striatum]|nr:hypothetical protein GQR58_015853 [Nymphon striatum]
MARKLTLEKQKFVIKRYWNHENSSDVIRQWQKTYQTPHPSRQTIYHIRAKFNETGSVVGSVLNDLAGPKRIAQKTTNILYLKQWEGCGGSIYEEKIRLQVESALISGKCLGRRVKDVGVKLVVCCYLDNMQADFREKILRPSDRTLNGGPVYGVINTNRKIRMLAFIKSKQLFNPSTAAEQISSIALMLTFGGKHQQVYRARGQISPSLMFRLGEYNTRENFADPQASNGNRSTDRQTEI